MPAQKAHAVARQRPAQPWDDGGHGSERTWGGQGTSQGWEVLWNSWPPPSENSTNQMVCLTAKNWLLEKLGAVGDISTWDGNGMIARSHRHPVFRTMTIILLRLKMPIGFRDAISSV